MESFPSNDALRDIRELSIGGEHGYEVSRFLYSNDESACFVEITWRNAAVRDQITYRFRGVVPADLWPVRFGAVEIDNAQVRQWDTPRPLRVKYGEIEVQFYASSVERIEDPPPSRSKR
jgi:hypothetical protein